MAEKSSRRVPDELAATPDEVDAAIRALTSSELLKLKKYADDRADFLGPKAGGRTGDDLLQIAIVDILELTRRWNKGKVMFAGFLKGAMRSISSNWARSYKETETAELDTDLLRENEEGELYSPLDTARDRDPDPEMQLSAKQTLKQIEALFADDEEAQMVLMAAQDGCTPPEVRELLDLSQTEYNTVVTRIRRRSRAAFIGKAHDKRGS